MYQYLQCTIKSSRTCVDSIDDESVEYWASTEKHLLIPNIVMKPVDLNLLLELSPTTDEHKKKSARQENICA